MSSGTYNEQQSPTNITFNGSVTVLMKNEWPDFVRNAYSKASEGGGGCLGSTNHVQTLIRAFKTINWHRPFSAHSSARFPERSMPGERQSAATASVGS